MLTFKHVDEILYIVFGTILNILQSVLLHGPIYFIGFYRYNERILHFVNFCLCTLLGAKR